MFNIQKNRLKSEWSRFVRDSQFLFPQNFKFFFSKTAKFGKMKLIFDAFSLMFSDSNLYRTISTFQFFGKKIFEALYSKPKNYILLNFPNLK